MTNPSNERYIKTKIENRMDELGEIAKNHPALFVNGYVLCDWVKEHLHRFDIEEEEINDFVNDMIEYVEDDGDDDI